MVKKYIIKLTDSEKQQLQSLVGEVKSGAKKQLKARVLLKSDAGWLDTEIAHAFDTTTRTIETYRKDFVVEGFEDFIAGRYRNREYRSKMDGNAEAFLIATACSEPPDGQAQWTLQLLADKLVKMNYVDSISSESVRLLLKKRTQTMA